MAFDLYEIKLFENNTVSFDLLKPADSSESIDLIMKDPKFESVTKEIKNYTVGALFKDGWNESREIFDILSERIISIDPNLKISPQKQYIGCKLGSSNIINFSPLKSGIDVQLLRVEPKDLSDPENRVTYVKSSFEYYNKHVSIFKANNLDDIDYAVMLIKQVYKIFTKSNS